MLDVFFGTDYHSHLGTRRGGLAAYDPELVDVGVGDPRAYGDMLVWDDEGGLVVILPGQDVIGDELAAAMERLPLV